MHKKMFHNDIISLEQQFCVLSCFGAPATWLTICKSDAQARGSVDRDQSQQTRDAPSR